MFKYMTFYFVTMVTESQYHKVYFYQHLITLP